MLQHIWFYMPEILILRQPKDEVYDRLQVDESELGNTVERLYDELHVTYTIEVLYDDSPRAKK